MRGITLAAAAVVAAAVLAGCPPATGPDLDTSVNTLYLGVEDGEYVTQKTFVVTNEGTADSTLSFEISSNEPWLDVSPESGTLVGTADQAVITVTVDRDFSEKAIPDFATATLTVQGFNAADESIGFESVEVTTAPNYFTEVFELTNDLDGVQLTFTPNEGPSFYGLETDNNVGSFPTSPSGGTILNFEFFGDPVQAGLFGGETVPFYGVNYSTLYVDSSGWVSFGVPGNDPNTVAAHFDVPQISLLPVYANVETATVSYLQDDEKIVLTWEDVASANSKQDLLNDFQLEMFFDGQIRVTYTDVDDSLSGVVGLSVGNGDGQNLPDGFLETDLNTPGMKSALF